MLSRGMEMWHPDRRSFISPREPGRSSTSARTTSPRSCICSAGSQGRGNRQDDLPGAAGDQPAPIRHAYPGRDADAHQRALELRVGRGRHAHDLVRRVGYGAAAHRDLWDEGTLSVPDPNTFSGPVRVRRAGASEWATLPLTHGYTENSRGLGVAEMAHALSSGRAHRGQRHAGLSRPGHHAEHSGGRRSGADVDAFEPRPNAPRRCHSV
jgi:hypothetical protein